MELVSKTGQFKFNKSSQFYSLIQNVCDYGLVRHNALLELALFKLTTFNNFVSTYAKIHYNGPPKTILYHIMYMHNKYGKSTPKM